jgi:hypothetical protein
MRLRAFPSAGIFIKAIGGELRCVVHIASAAEVPFAEVAGGVTRGVELARERRSLQRKKVRLFAGAVALPGLQVIGDAPARRKHAGEQPGARRRADGRGAVILHETRALPGELVEARRGCLPSAITTEIAKPEVVGENENDVRLSLRMDRKRTRDGRKGKQGKKPAGRGFHRESAEG